MKLQTPTPSGAKTSNYQSPAETIQFLQIPQQVILKPKNQTTTSDNSPVEWQTTQTPEPTPQLYSFLPHRVFIAPQQNEDSHFLFPS